MHDELFYRISLTMIADLGPVRVKTLIEQFGDATTVFSAKKKDLINCIGPSCAARIKDWKGFSAADEEITFMQQHKIRALFLTDKEYPKRLLHCFDPPSLLYYCGNADLNHQRIISIIGTRSHTAYGKQVTEEFINEMQQHNILVVSGLAFGIDSIAHKSAIQYNIPTVGVLGHGLDMVYPSQNSMLAKEMLNDGGLLTEYRMCTQPDKHNFPKRNRIVAGMADAVIVIETPVKGGSMITAGMAHGYNRDLFAVPGKINDSKSIGCLELIRQNKAILFSGAAHFIETMGWAEKKRSSKKQKELFIDLTDEEQTVVNLLKEKEMISIDELYLRSGLSNSQIATVILNLELQNVIRSLPGKRFMLA
jgi:DNA processing protein